MDLLPPYCATGEAAALYQLQGKWGVQNASDNVKKHVWHIQQLFIAFSPLALLNTYTSAKCCYVGVQGWWAADQTIVKPGRGRVFKDLKRPFWVSDRSKCFEWIYNYWKLYWCFYNDIFRDTTLCFSQKEGLTDPMSISVFPPMVTLPHLGRGLIGT